MENRELIYDLARRLNMVIEVHKKGEYIGKYKFINDKLHKLNDEIRNEDMPDLQSKEK